MERIVPGVAVAVDCGDCHAHELTRRRKVRPRTAAAADDAVAVAGIVMSNFLDDLSDVDSRICAFEFDARAL